MWKWLPSTDVDNGIFTYIGSGVMPAGGRAGESLVIQLRWTRNGGNISSAINGNILVLFPLLRTSTKRSDTLRRRQVYYTFSHWRSDHMLSKMHVNWVPQSNTRSANPHWFVAIYANPHWFVAMFLPLLDFHIPRAKLFSQPCSFWQQ